MSKIEYIEHIIDRINFDGFEVVKRNLLSKTKKAKLRKNKVQKHGKRCLDE